MTVAVVYVARGDSIGLLSIESFFDAYKHFPAGYPHRLVVIAKGWSNVPSLSRIAELAQSVGADLIRMPDDGFDWGAYMRIAGDLKEEFLCLLNTHSRPRVPGWLAFLRQHASLSDVGAVGATGSWSSISGGWSQFERDVQSMTLYPIRFVRDLAKICRYRRSFPAFPNPHLRSNAFMVARERFVSFSSCRSIPKSKQEAHILESGRNGFTVYLKSLGLRVVVVGADGVAYNPNEWIRSCTFRSPDQLNLLVSDNQTRNYQEAGFYLKGRLENAAWGQVLSLPVSSDSKIK